MEIISPMHVPSDDHLVVWQLRRRNKTEPCMYMAYEKSDERISFLCQHSESWSDERVTVYEIQPHVLVCRRRDFAKASASLKFVGR